MPIPVITSVNPAIAMASAAAGVAIAWWAWMALSFRTYEPADARDWELSMSRRQKLRLSSLSYRWWEPLIQEWATWIAGRPGPRLDQLERNLRTSNSKVPWKPEELIAIRYLQGILLGACVLMTWTIAGQAGLGFLLAILAVVGVPWLLLRTVSDLAARRRTAIKRRLPSAVDLIALMMEAGAGFMDSLKTVAVEQVGHPIGDEFASLCRDMSLGRTRNEALADMSERLGDDDVSEFVFAVNKGEELGTPLTTILRVQAAQMRLKRSQWLEKASAEAQVNMVFPGMVIMIACLLVVAWPFLLPLVMGS